MSSSWAPSELFSDDNSVQWCTFFVIIVRFHFSPKEFNPVLIITLNFNIQTSIDIQNVARLFEPYVHIALCKRMNIRLPLVLWFVSQCNTIPRSEHVLIFMLILRAVSSFKQKPINFKYCFPMAWLGGMVNGKLSCSYRIMSKDMVRIEWDI